MPYNPHRQRRTGYTPQLWSTSSAIQACGALLGAVVLGLLVCAPPAWAQRDSMDNAQGAASAAYWTAERLRQAVPMPLPEPTQALSHTAEKSVQEGISVGADGRGPIVRVRPDTRRLFEPMAPAAVETDQSFAEESLLVQPRSVGTEGAFFTSSRLVPLKADQVYPYRTVGKLFFRQPGEGDKVCSASVIKARLILTAGHCVHRGSGGGNGFFTDFLFIPAFRDGMDPYGSWSGVWVWTTSAWMTGGGEFPNAADYALIELEDKQGQRIADVVGFLGFQIRNLIPNHAHLLGYPVNLDGGMKMHQVTAGSFQPASPNAAEYGSDMRDGSSGGPWVQNFGKEAAGQTGNQNDGANRVIGVTSYGRIGRKFKVQGSSILDDRFTELLNEACARRQDNC